MDTHQFNVADYVTAGLFNNAMSAIANSEALLASGLSNGTGVISPDTLRFSFAGLNVTVNAGPPFAVLFPVASGQSILAQAHGVISGHDTQTYTVGFSSLVPTSGSVTTYLLASYVRIQQNSYQIIGPPPGHPDYNPAFVPYAPYSDSIDSIALTASLTPPDNLTTFSLGSVVLSSGQASITSITPPHSQRVTSPAGLNYNSITASKTLVRSDAGIWQLDSVGITFTLPVSVRTWGLQFKIINSSSAGTTVIQTQSSDVIQGFPGGASATRITLSPGQAVTLGAADNQYYLLGNVGGIGYIGLTTGSAGVGISGSPLTKNGTIDIELAYILNQIAYYGTVLAPFMRLGFGIANVNNAIQLNLAGGFYNWNNTIQLNAQYGTLCGVGWQNYVYSNIDTSWGLNFGGDAGQQMYVWTGAGLTTGSGPVTIAFGQCIGNYGGYIGVNLGPMMQNYGNGIAPILGPGIGNSNNAMTAYGWAFDTNVPGYYEAPSGLIIQWGWASVPGVPAGNRSNQLRVNFPIQFPNYLACISQSEGNNITYLGWLGVNFYSQDNGGFWVSGWNTPSQLLFYWTAIGW